MKISVVSPFFNEALILENSAELMIKNLSTLDCEWELILVDDGSKDNGAELVKTKFDKMDKIRILGYKQNQGRGYALKYGIDNSTGDYIFTTEVDSSWGDDIVHKMKNAFVLDRSVDVVIASPNLAGGGYKNVPFYRVMISKVGNKILKLLFTSPVTMHTGMTRGYKKEIIQGLSTYEKGKEFHLETLLKLHAEGFKFAEVPAILEWKTDKLAKTKGVERKSSSRIGKLIISHLGFAFTATPLKYLMLLSIFFISAGSLFEIGAIFKLLTGKVAVYFAITGFLSFALGIILFGFAVTSSQNSRILTELWKLDRKLKKSVEK